ncbi:Mitogen-activated protein kinase 15 [Sparganum proliferum]
METVQFTEGEVLAELMRLKESKSPGPDEISAKILKELAGELSKPLSMLFLTSFETGYLPPEWESGWITSLYKGGSRVSANNYRPASLTSICCKIMEKIIIQKLMKFLEQNHLLCKYQHGFRKGRSCVTNLLYCLEHWARAVDRGDMVHAIYIEFKKAFESVPHHRLLYKLSRIGPSNVLLDSDCFVKLCDFGLARSLAGRDLMGQSNSAISGNDEAVGDMPALTEYVATRWYRAPEILLACNNYTKGVDLWSMGCILGEMLAGKPLFPGASTLNQVERIMAGLPKPTKEDIESVKSSYSSSVLAKACVKQRKPVAEMMKNSDPNGIELMNLFLQFNPHKRITVDEALEHVYVKRFHNPIEEIRVSRPVLPPVSDNVQLSVAEYRNRLYQLIGEKKAPEKSRRPKRQSRTPSFDNSLPRTDSFKRQTTVLSSVSTEVVKPAAAKQPVRLDGRNLPMTPSSPPDERKRLLSSQPIEVCMGRAPIQNSASYPHVDENREKSPHGKNTQPQHTNSGKHLPSATSDYFSGQSRDVSAMWAEKEAIQKDENSSKTPPVSTNFVQISGSDEQKRNSTISKVEGVIGQEKISSHAFRQDASEYPSWTNSEVIAISNSDPLSREELVNAHPNIPTEKSVRSQSISRCQSVVCSNGTSTVSTPTRKLSPNLATTISETLESKSTNLSRMGSRLSSKESVAAAHRPASKKQSTPVQLPDSVSANSYLSVYANRTGPVLSAKQRFLVPTFVHQSPVNGDVQIGHTSDVPNGKPVSSKRFPEPGSSHGVGSYATVYLDNTQLETALPVRKRSVLFTKQVNGYQNPERWVKDTHPTNSDSENDFTKLASNANMSPLLKNFPTGSTASSAIPKITDEEAPYAFVSSVHRKREVAPYAPYLRAASNSQVLPFFLMQFTLALSQTNITLGNHSLLLCKRNSL